jgi:hypothetical protein
MVADDAVFRRNKNSERARRYIRTSQASDRENRLGEIAVSSKGACYLGCWG